MRPRRRCGQYIRAGGGFVGIHNAFGTEYNWPWYEGLLGNANYYDHGANAGRHGQHRRESDSSTDGLPQVWPFRDEWYNLEPFPTRVKFLATVDENHAGDAALRSIPATATSIRLPGASTTTAAARGCTTIGHDGAAFTDGSGFPGPAAVQTADRERHQVRDGTAFRSARAAGAAGIDSVRESAAAAIPERRAPAPR